MMCDQGQGDDAYLVREQQPDDVDVSAGRCQRQRRVVGHVTVLLVGAAREDELHHLVAAAAAGQ